MHRFRGGSSRELIEEQKRADLLRSYGIEPRHRLLLSGPPGNGKTSVAEAIASELLLPFYVIRYEGVVSSFLGETAARLDNAFEFVRTRRCVCSSMNSTQSPRNARTSTKPEKSSESYRHCFFKSTDFRHT